MQTLAEIPCVISIRRNADGVVRRYDDRWYYCSEYMWSAGNFSCDCNRELFFERAAGNEIDDEQCSEGRFSVRIEDKGGVILYDEFDG